MMPVGWCRRIVFKFCTLTLPHQLREKNQSSHLQRHNTQVVIVFIPFPLGVKASIPQARTDEIRFFSGFSVFLTVFFSV